MRSDLPPDCSRSLDYATTIETLKLLEGEELCLVISGGPGVVTGSDGAEAASRIQAKGILRHYAYSWGEGFALGAGFRVLLFEPDFVSASLRTIDGVDLFWVSIELADIKFSIGNPGGTETDEFGLFP
jgi:hypothetical protein